VFILLFLAGARTAGELILAVLTLLAVGTAIAVGVALGLTGSADPVLDFIGDLLHRS
jgi:hypothetical protein